MRARSAGLAVVETLNAFVSKSRQVVKRNPRVVVGGKVVVDSGSELNYVGRGTPGEKDEDGKAGVTIMSMDGKWFNIPFLRESMGQDQVAGNKEGSDRSRKPGPGVGLGMSKHGRTRFKESVEVA